MAPIINILIRLLPSLSGTPASRTHTTHEPSLVNNAHQHSIIQKANNRHHVPDIHSKASPLSTLSSISWGASRMDVFGLTANNLTHKYWDGSQWGPSVSDLETLGNGLASPPKAITWGANRMDVFGLDDHNVIKHQYWDGTAWRPDAASLENLGGACDPKYPLSASTWGEGRLDVFCTGPEGDLLHQYYDGSQWQPSTGSLESLKGELISGPSVVSWGSGRLDIFAVVDEGYVAHLYWDGSQWVGWETFSGGPQFYDTLTVTSWGENRLDVYGVAIDKSLYHKYWDGSQWSEWENLGGSLQGTVGATSWSADRIDIVGFGTDYTYFYKYYDGSSWQPSVKGWYPKGGSFTSSPSVVSWGVNRLDIFGVGGADEALNHQTWYGSGWYPSSTGWETLGGPLALVDHKLEASNGKGRVAEELR